MFNRLYFVFLITMALNISSAFSNEVKIEGTSLVKLHSNILNDDLLLKVQLPLGYKPSQIYPVLYMTDGNLYFETVSGVMRTIDFASMMGMPTVSYILVGIGYDTSDISQILLKRSRDLTPTVVTPAPMPWDIECGHADTFISSLEKEIFPFIESNFSAASKERSYFGHSYGGLFGAYVMLSRPDMFSGMILSSPSLWWDGEFISQLEKKYSSNNVSLGSTVYMGVGEAEEVEMTETFERLKTNMTSRNYKEFKFATEIHKSMGHVTVIAANFTMGLKFLNNYPDSL